VTVAAEPISPELVLVAPELREYALSLLPERPSYRPRVVVPLGAPIDLRRAVLVYGLVVSLRTLAFAIALASAFALLAIAAQLAS
jgi:hypothetical protein